MKLPAPPRAPRSPWQRLYAAALAARRRRLARRAGRLPVPVVSIGNLHLGGGGKTPITIAIAAHLRDAGRRVAVLSRGYGRSSRGPRIVSRGSGPEIDPGVAGDEPHLMARRLPGVAVVVGERRIEAGALALATIRPGPELFLLDDGFAHVRLRRDLDLLLFPAADPWAGGRLLPSGRLREPLAAAAHADAVMLTGAAAPERESAGAELARALAGFGFAGPGFAATTLARPPRLGAGATLAAGTPVLAVAAIARPEALFAAVEAAGLKLVGRHGFRDHHAYSAADARGLDRAARELGARVIVTSEKDVAKLEGRLETPLAALPVEARPEAAFWSWLDARLAELGE